MISHLSYFKLFVFRTGHIVLCSHSLRHHRGHPSNPMLQGEPLAMALVGEGPTAHSEQSGEPIDVDEEESGLGSSIEETGIGAGILSSMIMDSPSSHSQSQSQSKEDELMAGDAPKLKEQNQPTIVKIKPGHELKLKCDLSKEIICNNQLNNSQKSSSFYEYLQWNL